ncbi:hypothetical protein BDF22DRAFT_148491 [Syncephalis plumigaleata]|nr:hypothetical protein BDF22DRAFT_148491 [Syncephalis plumigaleata]
MSHPLSPSIITGTHPFIDNTVMSTPTTTILSSKGKAGLPFNSTAHQLSNPHWHDLSPINTMSSPITSTTPAVAETTETTATTTATTMTTINTTAKTVETALTSASSVVSTSTRPLSSGESSKKDEEWVSPGVVRHQSLFTHFTSLSTMMTSNQKLKKQGIESSGTHKQLPTRNSTVRRDLVAELQSSVTDPQSATITATATVSTPKAIRASPFKPIGIAFSQQRVASMREIREENENEVEEMKASPDEKSSSLLSDEEERLREEGRVKSFFTASTEALKQRLQSLRAKSSVFVASGSSNTATPESNILAPVNAEEKQNGRVDMVEQQHSNSSNLLKSLKVPVSRSIMIQKRMKMMKKSSKMLVIIHLDIVQLLTRTRMYL